MSEPGPQFWKAFAEFLEHRPALVKDSTARVTSAKGSYEYDFLSFPALLALLLPPLLKAGLAPSQVTSVQDGWLMLTTALTHAASGEALESVAHVCRLDVSGQPLGALLSFIKRYELSAICMVAPDDDTDASDPAVGGNGARTQPKPPRSKPKPVAQASVFVRLSDKIKAAATLKALDALMQHPATIEAIDALDSIEGGLIRSLDAVRRGELLKAAEPNPHRHNARAVLLGKDGRFQAFVREVHAAPEVVDEASAREWLLKFLNITTRSVLDTEEGRDALALFTDLDGEFQGWLAAGR